MFVLTLKKDRENREEKVRTAVEEESWMEFDFPIGIFEPFDKDNDRN